MIRVPYTVFDYVGTRYGKTSTTRSLPLSVMCYCVYRPPHLDTVYSVDTTHETFLPTSYDFLW